MKLSPRTKSFLTRPWRLAKCSTESSWGKASTYSAELILWLLSDKGLDRDQRRTLAQLLAGELHTRGARVKKGDDKRAYWELMAEIKAAHSEGHRTKTKRQLIELALSDRRAKGKGRATLLENGTSRTHTIKIQIYRKLSRRHDTCAYSFAQTRTEIRKCPTEKESAAPSNARKV